MAIDPATVTIVRRSGSDVADALEPLAAFINASFPRPWIEVTPALLRWYLLDHPWPDTPAHVVLAHGGGSLIGCAVAIPRLLASAGRPVASYIVSWVAVAPAFRGQRIVDRLYSALLQPIADAGHGVLTFAIDGSPGAAAIERAYPALGFIGNAFDAAESFAAIRGRMKIPPPSPAGRVGEPVALMRSGPVDRYLSRDPRGAVEVNSGIIATAAWRLTDREREPVILLDHVPAAITMEALVAAAESAFDALPDQGPLVVVTNMPRSLHGVAAGGGFRRLAAPTYRAWLWTGKGSTSREARSTSHGVL